MLTIFNQHDAENFLQKGDEDFRLIVYPNIINKFSFFLTGRATKGQEIFGVGPMAMRSYWSLYKYAGMVGFALEKGFHVFIRKDGEIFQDGDWFIEFRL